MTGSTCIKGVSADSSSNVSRRHTGVNCAQWGTDLTVLGFSEEETCDRDEDALYASMSFSTPSFD